MIAILHSCFAAEFDAALVVNADAFDPDGVADFDNVLDFVHAELGEFGDVAESIFARKNLDEGAEFFDGNDGALVEFTNRDFLGQPLMISLARLRLSPLLE